MKFKKAYLPAVRLWVFWCELPMALLLALAINYNDGVDYSPFKLYPLIVFCAAAMIFAFIYFFRLVRIGLDEFKCIGLFSSRDSVMVTEGRTLVIRMQRGGKLDINLIGNDGVVAGLDWLKSVGEAPRDISLFRAHAFGGATSAKAALIALGVSPEAAKAAATGILSKTDFEYVSVESSTEDGIRVIRVKFTKTA